VSSTVEIVPDDYETIQNVNWHGDIRSAHAQILNSSSEPAKVFHRRRHSDSYAEPWQTLTLNPGESYRFIMAKSRGPEIGPEIAFPSRIEVRLHEVFDRAHFPTVAIGEGEAKTDISPLPLYPGRQVAAHAVGASGD
jgi:pyruvate formate lyase activating enzyme